MQRLRIVGYNIRRARERLGQTQDQLAKNTGLNRATISRLEHGNRNASVALLFRVADALRVGADILVKIQTEHTTECEINSIVRACGCGFDNVRRLLNE